MGAPGSGASARAGELGCAEPGGARPLPADRVPLARRLGVGVRRPVDRAAWRVVLFPPILGRAALGRGCALDRREPVPVRSDLRRRRTGSPGRSWPLRGPCGITRHFRRVPAHAPWRLAVDGARGGCFRRRSSDDGSAYGAHSGHPRRPSHHRQHRCGRGAWASPKIRSNGSSDPSGRLTRGWAGSGPGARHHAGDRGGTRRPDRGSRAIP